MTSVKTIMSKKLKTISAGSTLQDAYAIMQESRIRHLPVLNEIGEITGILTYKDLIADKSILLMPVEYFMSFPVEQIHESTSLKNAALKMLEKKMSSLLITNDDADVIGIVTTDDLLWHLASHLQTETDEVPSPLSRIDLQTTVGEIARLLSQAGI